MYFPLNIEICILPVFSRFLFTMIQDSALKFRVSWGSILGSFFSDFPPGICEEIQQHWAPCPATVQGLHLDLGDNQGGESLSSFSRVTVCVVSGTNFRISSSSTAGMEQHGQLVEGRVYLAHGSRRTRGGCDGKRLAQQQEQRADRSHLGPQARRRERTRMA